MKKVTICFTVFISLLITSSILGQSSMGPFGDLVGKEIRSDNIFMLWQQESGGDVLSYQKIIKYDIENDLLDIQDDVTRNFTNKLVGGSRQMVAASGNLNNDLYDDVVTAWQGPNGTIELYIPKFDSTEAMWNAASSHSITGPITSEVNYLQGRILLEVADLNGSGRDEIIVVYKGEDQGIHLEVLGTDENLMPGLKDSLSVEQVYNTGYTHPPAALTIADMDGDGNPEIVVASLIKNGTNNNWALNLHRFEFNSNEKLVQLDPIVTGIQDVSGLFNYTQIRFSLASGKLIAGNSDQLLIAMSYDALGASGANDTFLYSYSYDQENDIMISLDRDEFNLVSDSNGMDPMSIKTGELDDDGLDEVMFSAEGRHHVIDIEENMFVEKFSVVQNSNKFGISYDYLEIADINQDGIDEFIIAINRIGSGQDYFQLRAFRAYDKEENLWRTSVGNVGQVLYHEYIPDGTAGSRRFAIAAGSFDGYKFRLGEPEYSVKTDDIQPLIILNAPPIHYDIFEGEEYDISNCSPVPDCAFNAQYLTSEEETSTITTEVKKDFAISAGVGYSGSVTVAPAGVGASVNQEAYFDVNYGRNFSEIGEEGESITITERITATSEDRIYASIADYDIWEYPVYEGAQEVPTRYILAMEPRNVRNQWYSSKSWNADRYIPSHEVGNILSYPFYEEVTDNPDVSHSIYNRPNSYQLDNSSDAVWELDISKFSSTEQDTTREIGYDAKVHLSGYRFSSAGARTNLSTHKTTVKNRFNVTVDLKSLDLSYGESRYNVTPYVYWNTNDALVIDYAAEPERSSAGGVQTWWEDFYGNDPDPAFILPWRYDPEKGLGLSEEVRRYRTKDIFFDNYEPATGDTLTITARIRNFSLVDSPPVTATFYVGDPDEGGELITGIEGESVVSTPDNIVAQRYTDVNLQWIVPADLPNNPRIYALLNEESEYNEIHQNNNKAYNVLNSSGVITSNDGSSQTQAQTFKLHQAYPNPFNPTTTIGYELPQNTDVRMEVFNILGQRVAILVNATQSAGYHEVSFDASSLSSGMYLYRLTTGQFTQTRKMMLVK